MSTDVQQGSSLEFRTRPLIIGAALIGAGTLLAMAGFAVGSSHLISATRRWVGEMEPPPREVAKLQWAKARTAAAAGTAAWQNGAPARQAADA
jgi:hypothetical protein